MRNTNRSLWMVFFYFLRRICSCNFNAPQRSVAYYISLITICIIHSFCCVIRDCRHICYNRIFSVKEIIYIYIYIICELILISNLKHICTKAELMLRHSLLEKKTLGDVVMLNNICAHSVSESLQIFII